MMLVVAPPGASDAGLPSDQQVTIPADRLIDITADDAKPVLHDAYA